MKFLRWTGHMDERDKLVRVRSWWPTLDKYGIGWPTLLVDRVGIGRVSTPIWQLATKR